MYKAADRKAKVKKKTIGGQNQFGVAHGVLMQAPKIKEDQANVPTRLDTDFKEYFDALAADATTEKGVLEELVKANASLTNTKA